MAADETRPAADGRGGRRVRFDLSRNEFYGAEKRSAIVFEEITGESAAMEWARDRDAHYTGTPVGTDAPLEIVIDTGEAAPGAITARFIKFAAIKKHFDGAAQPRPATDEQRIAIDEQFPSIADNPFVLRDRKA